MYIDKEILVRTVVFLGAFGKSRKATIRVVILIAANFGEQNGASVYFVERIKRNLCLPQLVCTERGADLP